MPKPFLRIFNSNKTEPDPAQLLEEIQGSLKGYIISLISKPNDFDDILQNTNAYLIENIEKFEIGTNFKAWAFRVAYFRVKEYIRARKSDGHVHLSDEIVEQLSQDASELVESDDDRYKELSNCLSSLKPKEQDLVKKHYLQRTPLTQLASQTETSANALHKAMSRIRKALRKCIENKS